MSRMASRPAIAITSISESQPAIQSSDIGWLWKWGTAGQAGIGDAEGFCNPDSCRAGLPCGQLRDGRFGPFGASCCKDRKGRETAHAYLATGRMVQTAWFFPRRRILRTWPLDRARGPD